MTVFALNFNYISLKMKFLKNEKSRNEKNFVQRQQHLYIFNLY